MNKKLFALDIRTFDCDGVVFINEKIGGIRPDPNDIIITGRSYEEIPETERMLASRSILNRVIYNPLKFDEKTRESSGYHKAKTLKKLQSQGYNILCHFEDDEIAIAIINSQCKDIPTIHLVHNLSIKENVRHF